MPLLRTRPSLRLRTPRSVVPGESFELAALLDAKVAVDIEWCELAVRGYELFDQQSHEFLPTHVAGLTGPRTLPVGTTTLPCRLTLPKDAPRSHAGPGARVVYDVTVHASVPWWPDARASFALHVGAPAVAPIAGQPRVAVSNMAGPQEGAPYVELSVGSDVAELGGVVDGSIAMRDVGGARTSVALVAYQRRPYGVTRVGSWAIPVDVREPGRALVFAFRVPEELTPTMTARSFALEYQLVASASVRFGELVSASLPLRVTDRGGVASSERVVAPHVGDARLEELFTAVGAAEGAQVEPGPVLVVRRGEVTAVASREVGPKGTRLAVRMTYPSLHMDLSLREPALPALARGRRAARRAGLGERCVVTARDELQASRLLERVAPLLSRAHAIEATDEALRYAVATSANDRASIGRVVREMRDLADALAQPPPLPTPLADALPAWQQLAADLRGVLETGHARVLARNDDATVLVVTVFEADGAPSGTLVRTRPTRELRLDRNIVIDDPEWVAPERLSPETVSALQRLARFGRVWVEPHEVRVTLDLALGRGVPVARAKEIVDASMRLAATLRASSGPFR